MSENINSTEHPMNQMIVLVEDCLDLIHYLLETQQQGPMSDTNYWQAKDSLKRIKRKFSKIRESLT